MAGVQSGEQFGAYRLAELIGRGGMGVVYSAEHAHLGRKVALKLLAPELAATPDFRQRFLQESRLAASLDHPNAVTVYDAGEIDGTLYIAMRFVQGSDLAELLREEGRLEPERALMILAQVGSALDAAHALGLVHRDVKPANVLIEGERCYLTDFGLTKRMAGGTALTQAGQFLGTVDYIAPEQIEGGPIDGRADIYALGCVLYQCLTGEPPYQRANDVAVIYAQLREPPPRPSQARPELPPAIDAVTAVAMAKEPDRRYRTCAEFVAAAAEALNATTIESRPTAPRAKPAPATAPSEPVPTAPLPPPSTGPRTLELGKDPTAPHVYGTTKRRGGARLVIPIALAVIALAVVAVLLLSGGDGGDGGQQASDQAPSQPKLASETFKVGKRPFGVAAGTGVVWVANASSGTVSRVATEGGILTNIPVGDNPFGMARSPDAVWVANADSGTVSRIDVKTGEAGPQVPVGDKPYFLSADASSVFVSNGESNSVSVLDARTGDPVGEDIPVGPSPRGIAAGGSAVWVAIKGKNTVQRIVNGSVVKEIPVGKNPLGVALGGNAVWVTNEEDGTVSRIDLKGGGSNVKTTRVGSEPFGITVGAGFVWVAVAGDNEVVRLDIATGKVVGDPIAVPDQPVGVSVGDNEVWVTSNDGNVLHRIDL